MKLLFVPVSDRPECALALNTAFELGKQLDASVMGCHIRQHKKSSVNMPIEIIAEQDSSSLNDEGSKAKKQNNLARKFFKKFAESHDYQLVKTPKSTASALWSKKVGSTDRVMSIMTPVTDLIIVSRPIKSKGSKGKKAAEFMMSALLKSSKPVLILPQSKINSTGKRICIAWNQSSAASRAVTASLPLLKNAEEVNIITCQSENKLGPKVKHLQTYLRCWGIEAKHIVKKAKSDSEALIQGYTDTKSDLMVMGAYSRSKLRQRIFGGVTQHMLDTAEIPVFMLHS
jgi:hypothetical protein